MLQEKKQAVEEEEEIYSSISYCLELYVEHDMITFN